MSSPTDLCAQASTAPSGCCDAPAPAPAVPLPIANPRGRSSIQYRIGTFTSFRRAMLDAVARPDLMATVSTSLAVDAGGSDATITIQDFTPFPAVSPFRVKIGTEYLQVIAGAGSAIWSVTRGADRSAPVGHSAGDVVILDPPNPFASWREGTDADYQTMFVELWAYLADVLTFYQERIANEAFITTATRRDSLLRLAELIDYRPGPGAGASALVAFTVQKDKAVTVPAGFRVGSKAAPGRAAAVFETSTAVTALADHNAIPVATVRYTNQFGRTTSGTRSVVLKGVNNGLSVGDYVLVVADEGISGEIGRPFRLTGVIVDKRANTTTITWPETPALVYDQSSKKVALYAFRVTAAPFGSNAPQWNTLPSTLTAPRAAGQGVPPYGDDWDVASGQAFFVAAGHFLFLDGIYEAAKGTADVPGWALLVGDTVGPVLFRVKDARPVSHTGYTLNARVTRLTFGDRSVDSIGFRTFPLRTTMVLAGNERLTLQNFLAVTDPITGSAVTLSGIHSQLQSGQSILLQGGVIDPISGEPGDVAAEWRVLDGPPVTDPIGNTTTVAFTNSLVNLYDPSSTVMMANVVEITQGESVRDEVLGSGSGGPFQAYALKKKPLTYLASSDPEGLSAVQSTLLVTVSAVQWTERPTLVDSAANASNFTTTLDDSGQTTVVFGDGFSGAIPPSGRNNIRARYRKGLGSSGNAAAGGIQQLIDNVPGLQKVTNPQASSGGADPESIDQIRVNGPSSLSTFGRAVGVEDYAALALRFPSIAKAAAVWVRRDANLQAVPQPYVQLTVAASDGTGITNTPTARNLRSFLDKHRDPNIPLRILDFTSVYLDVALTVDIKNGFPREATRARVRAALNPDPDPNPDGSVGYFSLRNLQFGEGIHLSTVYAVTQAVEGVRDVRVTTFRRMDMDAADPTKVRDDIFIRPGELAVIQNGRNNASASAGLLVVSAGSGGFIDT